MRHFLPRDRHELAVAAAWFVAVAAPYGLVLAVHTGFLTP